MNRQNRIKKASAIMALEPVQTKVNERWQALSSAMTAAKAVMAGKPVHKSDQWAVKAAQVA